MNLTACLSPILRMGLGILAVVVVGYLLEFNPISHVFAAPGINRQINFQGKLEDDENLNVPDGNYSIVFAIYNTTSGGNALWSETQSVSIVDGVFRVSLGSVTPIPSNMNFNWDGLYLGMKVESDAEMTPRIRLTAVPYAFNSERVAGLTVTDENGVASTSGTLKIPNGKTISFGDAFTTIGGGITLTASGDTNATLPTTGSITLVDLATTQTLTNKIIGSTGLTFTGATTDVTTGSNEDFTLTPNGSGDIVLSQDSDSAVLIGSSSNTPAVLSVSGGMGSNATLIVNQVNNADILSASASGATRIRVDQAGSMVFNGVTTDITTTSGEDLTLTAGGAGIVKLNDTVQISTLTNDKGLVYLSDASGTLTSLGNGTTGQCLTAVTSGAPTWTGCTGSGSNWNVVNGAISPKLATTVDFLLGSDASSSAKFAVLGINGSATPYASVSAQTGTRNGIALGGDGTIQSLRMNTMTLGGSTTGDIQFLPGNVTTMTLSGGNVGLGTTAPRARLDVIGNVNIAGTATASALAVGYQGIGAGTGNAIFSGSVGIGTSTIGDALEVVGSIDASVGYKVGNVAGVSTSNMNCVNVVGGIVTAAGTCSASGGGSNWVLSTTNGTLSPINNTVDLLIGGTSTASAKFAVLGMNGSGPATASVSGNMIVMSHNGAGGNLGIGDTNPTAKLDISGTNIGAINYENTSTSGTKYGIFGTTTVTANGASAVGADIEVYAQGGGVNAASLYGVFVNVSSFSGGTATEGYGLYIDQMSSGIATRYAIYQGGANDTNFFSGNVGIGTSSPITKLNVNGRSTGKALAIFNETGDQNIFTASASGTTRFVIQNDGNVGIGTTAPTQKLEVAGILSMANNAIVSVDSMTINDPGPGEGIVFGNTAATWRMDITPLDRSNADGNLNLYGTANNIALWRPSLWVYDASNYATATALSDGGINLTTTGTGNIGLNPGGNVGIGTTAPLGLLNVNGRATGKALAIFNETGNQDIFTASASGTPRFSITNAGGIRLGTSEGVNGNCLLSGGPAAASTWGSCGAGSSQWTTTGSDIYYNGGNVGIGTTNPTRPFQISANAPDSSNGTIAYLSGNLTSTSNNQIGLFADININVSGAAANTYTGLQGAIYAGESGTNLQNASMIGLRGSAYFDGVGDTYGEVKGGDYSLTLAANSTINSAYGLMINNATNSSGGTISSLYGLAIAGQTTGVDSVGLAIAEATGTDDDVNLLIGTLTVPNADYSIYNSSTKQNYFAGNVGIGTTAPDSKFQVVQTLTDTSGFLNMGLNQLTTNPGGTSTATTIALWNRSMTGSGTTQDISEINGIYNEVVHQGQAGSVLSLAVANASNLKLTNTGTISQGYGNYINTQVTAAGTITEATGLYVNEPGLSNGGAVTTMIGAQVANLANATNNTHLILGDTVPSGNYGIYNSSTYNNYFAGNVGIGTTTPTEKVHVTGGNVKIDAQTNSITALAKISQSEPGQIASGDTTLIASVSASAVYNGSLYVGTGRGSATPAGGAEIYRFDNGGSNWTKVSQATAGTIASGGTANIASVSAMTVFNGSLYVGTAKTGAAEVYRYDGSSSWTKVSQTTAGTIGGGGQTAIDAVTAMVVHGGKLYIGTKKNAAAEVYRYEGSVGWTRITTTAGATNNAVANGGTAVDAIMSMASYNSNLYIGTKKGFASNVFKMNGAPAAAAFTVVGTIGNLCGSTTQSEVAVLSVYSGRLYAGVNKDGGNGATVCRYEDNIAGTGTSWTLVTSAAGRIQIGGTANIDGIASMTSYNGRLYIGTRETNSAQIYQFIDGNNWILLNNTPGTLVSGGTASIDAVTTLQQYNGTLYAGTSETNPSTTTAAEVYTYANVADQSYALKFHAASRSTNEVNGLTNDGSIWFMASASAVLNTGNSPNTGSFMFSHGLITGAGAYDVAEDYPTRDTLLEPGDLVTIDENEAGFVKKATGLADSHVIGVYSLNPAFRLSQIDSSINGAPVIPVALVGRVPVKVSTENGSIKSGDYLTSSSVPGVAMKATKAGRVIGKALSGYTDDGVGKIEIFISASNFNGEAVTTTIPGLFTDDMPEMSRAIEGYFSILGIGTAKPIDSDALSQIVTDRVVAGLEVVTPRIVADEIFAKTIHADKIVGLELLESGIKDQAGKIKRIEDMLASASATSQSVGTTRGSRDSIASLRDGQQVLPASDSAMTKTLAKVDELLGKASSSRKSVLGANYIDEFVVSQATISGTFRVQGDGLFEGVLSVIDSITTENLYVSGLSQFFGEVVFKNNVGFAKAPTFSSDTAGYITVRKGEKEATVTFANAYEKTPVINATLMSEDLTDEAYKAYKAQGVCDQNDSRDLCEDKVAQKLLDADISYVVAKKSSKGFTIRLKKEADEDYALSWTAIAVGAPADKEKDKELDKKAKKVLDSLMTIQD